MRVVELAIVAFDHPRQVEQVELRRTVETVREAVRVAAVVPGLNSL